MEDERAHRAAPSLELSAFRSVLLVRLQTGRDWIATVPSFPPNFFYRSMISRTQALSKLLRDPEGPHQVDLVIALTHCRLPNDIDLALALNCVKDPKDEHGVDLILGGHDHTYFVGKGVEEYKGEEYDSGPGTENDKDQDGFRTRIVKSGTDFRDLSQIELQVGKCKENHIRKSVIKNMKVQRHRTSPSDPTSDELSSLVSDLVSRISKSTNEVIAHTLTPWDARSEKVRTDESALGNFIADILMHSYDETLRERERRGELDCSGRDKDFRQVDCALLCGGALRGDSVYTTNITLGNVLEILPFEDATVVKELSGQNIWDALENGLSAYPKQEGRFSVIAGLAVKWDSRKPPFKRLVSVDVLDDVHMLDESGSKVSKSRMYEYIPHPNDEGATIKVHRPTLKIKDSLKMDRKYRVVTREYMAVDGHDGYKSLEEGKYIIDHENGVLASALVRKFLLGASLLWRLKNVRNGEEGEAEADDDGNRTHMMDQSVDSIRSKTTNGDESSKREGTLSKKTRKAIERARLLAEEEEEDEEDPKEKTDQKPSSSSRNRSSSTSNDPPSTPSRPRPQLNNRGKSEFLIRTVVDQSPGGIRDALHAGGYEHHSQRDPVHRRFNDPASTNHDRSKSSDGDSKPSASNGIESPKASKSSTVENRSSKVPKEAVQEGSHETKRGVIKSNSEVAIEQIEVDQDEIEEMKEGDGDLAMVCPLRDGRLIDVGRESA